MERVQGQTIADESLTLDGKEFVDCTLVNCVLNYSGGPVIFEHTLFQGCRYVFFGPARMTVHFLQGVHLLANNLGEWAEAPEYVQ